MARSDPAWAQFEEWVRSRPPVVRELMIDWPPLCVVRTVPGVMLLIPAPGVEGTVQSYFEGGTLGVAAPVTIPHPVHGWGPLGREAVEGELASAEVDPGQLVLVRPTRWTSDDVRSVLDG